MFKRLTEWDFDIFTISYDELPALVFHVLLSHPAVSDSASGLNLPKLWRYVGEIAAKYHRRPFHNFRHAVDGEMPGSRPRPLVSSERTIVAFIVAAIIIIRCSLLSPLLRWLCVRPA